MKVGVFGSSSAHPSSREWKSAYRFGVLAAERGWTVVCGGYGGIMEGVSKGVRDGGGRVIGICTAELNRTPNPYLTEVEWVPTYPLRLARLIEVAEVYVFFEGGIGTFTELFLVLTMRNRQIGTSKPCIVIGKEMEEKVREVLRSINEETSRIIFVVQPEDAARVIERGL